MNSIFWAKELQIKSIHKKLPEFFQYIYRSIEQAIMDNCECTRVPFLIGCVDKYGNELHKLAKASANQYSNYYGLLKSDNGYKMVSDTIIDSYDLESAIRCLWRLGFDISVSCEDYDAKGNPSIKYLFNVQKDVHDYYIPDTYVTCHNPELMTMHINWSDEYAHYRFKETPESMMQRRHQSSSGGGDLMTGMLIGGMFF